jgi:adenine-specific DNA-methyltransferase
LDRANGAFHRRALARPTAWLKLQGRLVNFKHLESAQKLRGSYYTEPDIAEFLARWVLEIQPERLLEPACGDGAFFRALHRIRPKRLCELVACEIDPLEAKSAQILADRLTGVNGTVHIGDFLEWSLKRIDELPRFDGVLGNPPFIRYQYLDAELQRQSERLFSRFDLPFTKHTNAWVPFVIASLALLRPGGRLGMVVPAELLHVLHARSLRDFLLANCAQIVVLDPKDIWFGDTLQGIVLLLAEKSLDRNRGNARISVKALSERAELDRNPNELVANADFIPGAAMNGKWMLSLLSRQEQAVLDRLRSHACVKAFQEVASVDVGIVTGANKFFLVADSVVEEFGLESWSHPMFGRSEHVRGVVYDKRDHEENRRLGLPTNFIWFKAETLSSLPEEVRRYIRRGESHGLHQRYKCRVRSPWYAVPSVYAAPVGMLKRSHHFPRLILNKANAFTTDTAYRIQPKTMAAVDLVGSFINSLTALTTELEGRHYGGGVLELVPSEIEKVLVPTVHFDSDAFRQLNSLIRSGAEPEEILSKQDRLVLRPLGIKKHECDDLLNAWLRMRQRRHRKRDVGQLALF